MLKHCICVSSRKLNSKGIKLNAQFDESIIFEGFIILKKIELGFMPNLGILVLWTLTHEIEFLRLSIIFQLGHPEPPSFLFAGELAFAMVGGDTGECP